MATKGFQNLTLTQAQLATCKPRPSKGGRALRAYCPFHGSDKQRSLRIDATTGRFNCFACGAWGYTEEARERWAADRQAERANNPTRNPPGVKPLAAEREAPPPPARSDLPALLKTYQDALPGTWGAKYLEHRKIPLKLARQYGVGYAAAGTWPGREWRWGRLVFPHTEPGGEVVNLYGRAVGSNEKVPKALRHDHLSGTKGVFNAAALHGEGPLFVCEGAFDALSLIAAGHPRALAVFGVDGWRWEWAREVQQLVCAMDADKAGAKWRELARQAVLRGKQVAYLPAEAYGGHKDASEAWAAGVLRIGAWPGATTEKDPETAEELMARQGWVLIESGVLGERIALAKNETAARQAPKETVTYTLAEMGRIGDNAEALRAIHQAKRLIGGTVTAVRHVPAQEAKQEVLAL